MNQSSPETLNYCVVRSGDREMPLDYEVLRRRPDGGLQAYPCPKAQNIWDEITRQVNETVDCDKHYMQRYFKKDKPTCFQVEFLSLGFSCHWSNLQGGVSQWLCETRNRKPDEAEADALHEKMTLYDHKLFRGQLVSVPWKVCFYLSGLLKLAPPMNCGCSECGRNASSNTYTITVHVDNSGDDPRPLAGASYLVFTICDRLLVREFFSILKGSPQMCPARSYFRQIVGSTAYPDTCVYGKCYPYDAYKTGDVRMGDLDLDFSCSPGGRKDVLVMMGVDSSGGLIEAQGAIL